MKPNVVKVGQVWQNVVEYVVQSIDANGGCYMLSPSGGTGGYTMAQDLFSSNNWKFIGLSYGVTSILFDSIWSFCGDLATIGYNEVGGQDWVTINVPGKTTIEMTPAQFGWKVANGLRNIGYGGASGGYSMGCSVPSNTCPDCNKPGPKGSEPPVNDHTCPACGNNRCSKTEKSCWRCGGLL